MLPDPARAEQGDLHRPLLAWHGAVAAEPAQGGREDPTPDRRALRRAAARSLSCSTISQPS